MHAHPPPPSPRAPRAAGPAPIEAMYMCTCKARLHTHTLHRAGSTRRILLRANKKSSDKACTSLHCCVRTTHTHTRARAHKRQLGDSSTHLRKRQRQRRWDQSHACSVRAGSDHHQRALTAPARRSNTPGWGAGPQRHTNTHTHARACLPALVPTHAREQQHTKCPPSTCPKTMAAQSFARLIVRVAAGMSLARQQAARRQHHMHACTVLPGQPCAGRPQQRRSRRRESDITGVFCRTAARAPLAMIVCQHAGCCGRSAVTTAATTTTALAEPHGRPQQATLLARTRTVLATQWSRRLCM
jgi:hypothetical protein